MNRPKIITYRITLDYSTWSDTYHPSKWMEPEVLLGGDGGEVISWVGAEEVSTPKEHKEKLKEEIE